MVIHRASDIEKQQHFDGIAALWPQLHIQKALFRGALDGAVQIQLFGSPRAGKLPQPPEGYFDSACS